MANNINELSYDIDPAPKKLELNDYEKVKSKDGTPLEIEVRGERNPKKCYFKVSDVAKAFEMENLENVLLNKDRGYDKDRHYKNFTITSKNNNNNKIKLKKVLFLTFRGLQRVIEVNRNKIITDNIKYILHTWLNNTCNTSVINYNINLENKKENDYGYVYCITSYLCNGVKIGYWKGTIYGLRKRYVTYYGNDLNIFYVYTKYPKELEQKCFNRFIEYKIVNEIYEKDFFELYTNYLNNNILA